MCISFQVSYLLPGFTWCCMVLAVMIKLKLYILQCSFVFTLLYAISRSRQQTKNMIHWKVKNIINSTHWNNFLHRICILYSATICNDPNGCFLHKNLMKLPTDPPIQFTTKAQYQHLPFAGLDEKKCYQTVGRHILDNSVVNISSSRKYIFKSRTHSSWKEEQTQIFKIMISFLNANFDGNGRLTSFPSYKFYN